jgi:hypothetical protein
MEGKAFSTYNRYLGIFAAFLKRIKKKAGAKVRNA